MKTRIATLIINAIVVAALALLAHAVEAAPRAADVPGDVARSAVATMEHWLAAGDAAWAAGDRQVAADAYGVAYAIAVVELPNHRARLAYAHILRRIGRSGAYPAPAGTGYLSAAMDLSRIFGVGAGPLAAGGETVSPRHYGEADPKMSDVSPRG